MISILQAPPFTSVQDLGRTGYLHSAVPRAGALDVVALAAANLLVGNEAGAAALECSIGRAEIGFERETMVALTGASAVASTGGRTIESGQAVRIGAGDSLLIERLESGAWLYVAVSGGINVPLVLGSRATYLPARFGGLEGRLLRNGDRLPLGTETRRAKSRALPSELAVGVSRDPIRLLPGPERGLLTAEAWDRLTCTEYTVSTAVSRMGYCLTAAQPGIPVARDLPSAPACIGTLQLPSGGEPIVLLCDGPTVGGYARAGVVASADIGRFAQLRPGELARFREVDETEARQALRQQRVLLDRLERGA